MKRDEIAAAEKALRRRRDAIFREVAGTEAQLEEIAEHRDPEFEERAQKERTARLFARLDLRGKQEIEEIDAALDRIAAGTFGSCTRCGRRIAAARLRALPATPFCLRCAGAAEPAAVEESFEEPRLGPVPADFAGMTDRETTAALREQLRAGGRIDLHELRLVCRHGVVHLSGALPSEAQHQWLLKEIADVAGFEEIVDRIQVQEILWERSERSGRRRREGTPRGVEPADTEDVVRSIEEGIDYVPPMEPPANEE